MTVRTCIFFLATAFCFTASSAQTSGKAEATVNKNRLLIGEQLQLTITVQAVPGNTVRFPTDSLPHFEIVGKPVIDTLGDNHYKASYTITSFDSGHWTIPSFIFAADLRTDTIPVDVVFSDFNRDQPYHDIADVMDVPVVEKKTSWWLFIAGGLLALLVFYLVFRKKRKAEKPAPAPPVPVDAYREAMRQLQELEGAALPVKEFYAALTDIFRLYVYRTKGILSLQKTTDDLVVQLRSLQLGKEQFEQLSQALRMSDFVKFAKYIPPDSENSTCLNAVKQSVMGIEELDRIRKEQKNKKHS